MKLLLAVVWKTLAVVGATIGTMVVIGWVTRIGLLAAFFGVLAGVATSERVAQI